MVLNVKMFYTQHKDNYEESSKCVISVSSVNNGIENNYCFQTGFLQSDIGQSNIQNSHHWLSQSVMRVMLKTPQSQCLHILGEINVTFSQNV